MDRDALVERIRDVIAPHMGCEDCGTGPGECPCHDAARAALAAVAPLIAAEALERAAKVADKFAADFDEMVKRMAIMPSAAVPYAMRATDARDLAAAIRALKEP